MAGDDAVCCCASEARDVGVALPSAQGMIGAGDLRDSGLAELALRAIDRVAELACGDEQVGVKVLREDEEISGAIPRRWVNPSDAGARTRSPGPVGALLARSSSPAGG